MRRSLRFRDPLQAHSSVFKAPGKAHILAMRSSARAARAQQTLREVCSRSIVPFGSCPSNVRFASRRQKLATPLSASFVHSALRPSQSFVAAPPLPESRRTLDAPPRGPERRLRAEPIAAGSIPNALSRSRPDPVRHFNSGPRTCQSPGPPASGKV
jgi:hypothetical protein